MLEIKYPGHLNVLIRDHDSAVTGFGKHDRVVAFDPRGNELFMRVDHKWGLGMPTSSQMLQAARLDNGLRGRWTLERIEPRDDGRVTYVFFTRSIPL